MNLFILEKRVTGYFLNNEKNFLMNHSTPSEIYATLKDLGITLHDNAVDKSAIPIIHRREKWLQLLPQLVIKPFQTLRFSTDTFENHYTHHISENSITSMKILLLFLAAHGAVHQFLDQWSFCAEDSVSYSPALCETGSFQWNMIIGIRFSCQVVLSILVYCLLKLRAVCSRLYLAEIIFCLCICVQMAGYM